MDISSHISQLYRTLGREILKFVLKRNGGDMEAAQQVLQDTFVAAFKSYHTFRHKSTYFTWLCKIALNKISDYYRDQVNHRSRLVVPGLSQLELILDPGLTPEEAAAAAELRNQLSNCLNLLPSQYRRLLQLKYYLTLSNREICLKLDLTPRKLEGRMYRAKKALAKVVSARFPELKPPHLP